jgi:hypothetical protein
MIFLQVCFFLTVEKKFVLKSRGKVNNYGPPVYLAGNPANLLETLLCKNFILIKQIWVTDYTDFLSFIPKGKICQENFLKIRHQELNQKFLFFS